MIEASYVKHIFVQTKGSYPKMFKIEPSTLYFKTKITLPISIKGKILESGRVYQIIKIEGIQYWVVINNTTTGWRL